MSANTEAGVVRRFLFEQRDIRGVHVRLTDAWRAMQAGRGYPDAVRALLGELCAVTVIIASQLKQPGRLSVQMQGSGPVSLLVIDCDRELKMRGMARAAAGAAAGSVGELLGDGKLAITLLPDHVQQPYQSIVPLQGSGVAEIFEHFLEQSEQAASALWLAADADCASGLFLQQMPGAAALDPDTWARLTQLAATVTRAELLELDAETLIRRLFAEDVAAAEVRLFGPHGVCFHCPKDWTKVRNMLRSLGKSEVQSILAEHGEVVVHDDICNHEYRLDAAGVAALFEERDCGTDD
ncbi:MAG: Hsp33 family molecular chaperone HslO [Rhodocyclaceae bacterium]|nr:Hsp33 family molecular chaperone HslO [Rhodocyclaceae bacterium]MBX3668405.1 Hsp33 family molecular chaperone HslO [Rhodocyclaceae bacterium]